MTPVELQAVGVEHDPQNASKVYPAGDLHLMMLIYNTPVYDFSPTKPPRLPFPLPPQG